MHHPSSLSIFSSFPASCQLTQPTALLLIPFASAAFGPTFFTFILSLSTGFDIMSATLRAAGLASALFATANAHGLVQGVIYKGEWIQGYTPSLQYQSPEPETPGWRIPEDLSNGFIDPTQYATDNITCHVGWSPRPSILISEALADYTYRRRKRSNAHQCDCR